RDISDLLPAYVQSANRPSSMPASRAKTAITARRAEPDRRRASAAAAATASTSAVATAASSQVHLMLSMTARPDGLATATSSDRNARFPRNWLSIYFSSVNLPAPPSLFRSPVPFPGRSAQAGASAAEWEVVLVPQ